MNKTESKFDNKLFKIINNVLKFIKIITYFLQKVLNFAGASKQK